MSICSIHCIIHPTAYQLQLVTQDSLPEPKGHDVLIHVAAAGVNRADIYQAQGSYLPPEGASPILGLEVAGTIIAMGEKVRSHALGDKVCALLQGGGYAEQVCVPEWRVLPIPKGLTMVEAASIPEVAFTSYLNLMELAQLKPSDRVLIHGGASGVGSFAIQLVKAFGAQVFTTVGGQEKIAFCKALGADTVIHYPTEDFVAIAKPVDVVLDMVGGSYLQRNLSVLAPYGRMVSIAFIQGAKAELNMASLLLKNLSWMGSTLRFRSEEQIYQLAQSIRSVVWGLIEQGKIKPTIDRVFALEAAQQAHEHMFNFQHCGKIVLEIK